MVASTINGNLALVSSNGTPANGTFEEKEAWITNGFEAL